MASVDTFPSLVEDRPNADRIGRDAVTYALGGLAGKVAGVVLLPFLSRALGPEGYGRFDILNTVAATVPVILSLGMDAAATRLAFTPRWTDRRSDLLGSWLSVVLTLMVVSGVVLAIGATSIATALFSSTAHASSIRWLALIVPLSVLSIFVLTVLRIEGRAAAYALTTGSALVLNALLTVALVLVTGWGVDAALAAWAIALGATTAIAFAVSFIRPRIRTRSAFEALARFGVPLIPALAIGLAAELINRSVLLLSSSATEVAYLSVAIRVASVISLAGTAFLLAWQPRAYAASADPAGLETAWRHVRRFAAAAVLASIALAIAAGPVIGILAGPDYLAATPIVGLLALGALATVLVQIVSLGSALALRSHEIAISISSGAVVSVALNIPLARSDGALGTGIAMTVGPLLAVAVGAILARRHGHPVVGAGRLFGGIAIGAAGVLAVALGGNPMSFGSLAIAAATAGVSTAILLREVPTR